MADNQVSQTSSADTPASAAGSYNKNGLGVLAFAAIVRQLYARRRNLQPAPKYGRRSLCRSRFAGMADYRFRYLFYARTFSILSMAKPDLKTGIYSYSRAGFGPYVGFTIGWSYWLCQVCVMSVMPLSPWMPSIISSRRILPAATTSLPSSEDRSLSGVSIIWFCAAYDRPAISTPSAP